MCTNRRPVGGRPACGNRGGVELAAALRHEVASRPELWGQVAVTACDCLGPCFDGPNLVIYPEAVWYAGVTADDAGEIADEHLTAGRVIARLVYDWPDEG